jgi:hypothetical protein
MDRIAGGSRPFGDLTLDGLVELAGAHRKIQHLAPPVRRPAKRPRVEIQARAAIERLRATGLELRPKIVADALGAAGTWLATTAAGRPVGKATSGGVADTNAANYVWQDGRVWLLDFEDARWRDPVFEAVELVEHLANRDLRADQTGIVFDLCKVDARRGIVRDQRRLAAAFWLGVLEANARRGNLSRRQVTPEAQAARVLTLLG